MKGKNQGQPKMVTCMKMRRAAKNNPLKMAFNVNPFDEKVINNVPTLVYSNCDIIFGGGRVCEEVDDNNNNYEKLIKLLYIPYLNLKKE